jgi:phage terminase small subunit
MLSHTQSTPTAPPPPPLSSRKELFSHHVARGASLAQAARLAGYSPQGARQRGSVLMAESDVRLRVETLRHAWMAERQGRVERAIERRDTIIDMAMELQRPTAALKAMDLQLKLAGVIRDTRAGLYADSPDDDLSKAFFDPREDEDPDFDPAPQSGPAEAEAFLPTREEPEDDPEEDDA